MCSLSTYRNVTDCVDLVLSTFLHSHDFLILGGLIDYLKEEFYIPQHKKCLRIIKHNPPFAFFRLKRCSQLTPFVCFQVVGEDLLWILIWMVLKCGFQILTLKSVEVAETFALSAWCSVMPYIPLCLRTKCLCFSTMPKRKSQKEIYFS